jgi:hypothetical protein
MKKKINPLMQFIPLVVTLSLYLVFSSRVQCKPSHAGFWLVLALGMAVGVSLVRIFQWVRERSSPQG